MNEETLYRDELVVDQVYGFLGDDTHFVSPDGVGVYYYDTLEELRDDYGFPSTSVIYVDELSDFDRPEGVSA